MESRIRKSVAPFYAVAVIWLVYSLLFPLYKALHYGILITASVVVFLLISLLCRDSAKIPAAAAATAKPKEVKKEEATWNP